MAHRGTAHRGRRARWSPAAPVAVALASLLTAGVLLARHGSILVHQCVPAEGTAGWLGLRLALLRTDAACPTGSLAVGGDSRQALGVVVMVTVPLLLGHVAALAVGLGLLARARGLVRSASAALSVVPRLPAEVPATRPVRRLAAVAGTSLVVVVRRVTESLQRRGPPLSQLA